MNIFIKSLLWFLLVSFISVVGIFLLSLQSSAHIEQTHIINAQAASESKKVVQRLGYIFNSKKQPAIISISQAELNGLNALAHRAFPKVISDVSIHKTVLIIEMSIELPFPDPIKYLNITGTVLPSNYGLLLGEFKVGNISVSGRWLLNVAKWAVNTFIKEDLGDYSIDSIKWLMLSQNQLLASIEIPKELSLSNNNGKSGLQELRDKFTFFGDVKRVQFYYHSLLEYVEKNALNQRLKDTSLSGYLGHMFKIATEQSLRGVEISAITENYSALMALSLYFGSDKFELLIGDVSQLSPEQILQRDELRRRTTLANRVDLQKHFIYSIALQLLGSSDASDAIGEVKEFLDSNGGSGFSFADLLADRAGTRLAKTATNDEENAIQVQSLLSGITSESKIMPLVVGLPEGLSIKTFETNYSDVNSLKYKEMLAVIDKRLAVISVYRLLRTF